MGLGRKAKNNASKATIQPGYDNLLWKITYGDGSVYEIYYNITGVNQISQPDIDQIIRYYYNINNQSGGNGVSPIYIPLPNPVTIPAPAPVPILLYP